MVKFNENDLVRNDYVNTITDGDNPNYTEISKRETVNRNELHEMVWFCDAYVKNHNVPQNHMSFAKTETIIRLSAPVEMVKRDELIRFIEERWENFDIIKQ